MCVSLRCDTNVGSGTKPAKDAAQVADTRVRSRARNAAPRRAARQGRDGRLALAMQREPRARRPGCGCLPGDGVSASVAAQPGAGIVLDQRFDSRRQTTPPRGSATASSYTDLRRNIDSAPIRAHAIRLRPHSDGAGTGCRRRVRGKHGTDDPPENPLNIGFRALS